MGNNLLPAFHETVCMINCYVNQLILPVDEIQPRLYLVALGQTIVHLKSIPSDPEKRSEAFFRPVHPVSLVTLN